MDAGKQNFHVGGVGKNQPLHHQKANLGEGSPETTLPSDTYSFGATPMAPAGDQVVAQNEGEVVAEATGGVSVSKSSAPSVPTILSFDIGAPGLTDSGPVGVAGLNGLRQAPVAGRLGQPTMTAIGGNPHEARITTTHADIFGIEHASEGIYPARVDGGSRSYAGTQARLDQGLGG